MNERMVINEHGPYHKAIDEGGTQWSPVRGGKEVLT